MSEQSYQCLACGLHYASEELAKQCGQFCTAHNACNPDIARQSIELQKDKA